MEWQALSSISIFIHLYQPLELLNNSKCFSFFYPRQNCRHSHQRRLGLELEGKDKLWPSNPKRMSKEFPKASNKIKHIKTFLWFSYQKIYAIWTNNTYQKNFWHIQKKPHNLIDQIYKIRVKKGRHYWQGTPSQHSFDNQLPFIIST